MWALDHQDKEDGERWEVELLSPIPMRTRRWTGEEDGVDLEAQAELDQLKSFR